MQRCDRNLQDVWAKDLLSQVWRLGVFGMQIEFPKILQFLCLVDIGIPKNIVYIFKNTLNCGWRRLEVSRQWSESCWWWLESNRWWPESDRRWPVAVVGGAGWRLGVVALGGNKGILVFLPRDNIPFPWKCWIPMGRGGNVFWGFFFYLLGNARKFFRTLYQI